MAVADGDHHNGNKRKLLHARPTKPAHLLSGVIKQKENGSFNGIDLIDSIRSLHNCRAWGNVRCRGAATARCAANLSMQVPSAVLVHEDHPFVRVGA